MKKSSDRQMDKIVSCENNTQWQLNSYNYFGKKKWEKPSNFTSDWNKNNGSWIEQKDWSHWDVQIVTIRVMSLKVAWTLSSHYPPWHECSWQRLISYPCPTQSLPLPLVMGSLHALSRCCSPPPHGMSHSVHAAHTDHCPSTLVTCEPASESKVKL